MRILLLESLLVAGVGLAVALVANALSPQGLKLSFNYFPLDQPADASPPPLTNTAASSPASAQAPSSRELLAAQVQQLGIHLADSNQVVRWFHDPRCEQDLVVFIDARADQEYQQGHIPGAYQLDYYHWDKYLPTLLPRCAAAEQIIVYCNGGACEDSLLAAKLLCSANVPGEKLYVYGGGITEWTGNRLPLERGLRGNGALQNYEKQ